MNKLNFGCGSIQPDGWDNLDRMPEFKAPFQMIFQLPNKRYDMVVAHCSLQMNNFLDLPDLLNNIYNFMAPGGVFRISLPDIIQGFENYKAGNIGWLPNGEDNIDIRFSAWLTWYSTTKTLLTQGALTKLLTEAGFSKVVEASYKKTILSTPEIVDLDTRENECYFLEAMK